jgi:hypothetical protein
VKENVIENHFYLPGAVETIKHTSIQKNILKILTTIFRAYTNFYMEKNNQKSTWKTFPYNLFLSSSIYSCTPRKVFSIYVCLYFNFFPPIFFRYHQTLIKQIERQFFSCICGVHEYLPKAPF